MNTLIGFLRKLKLVHWLAVVIVILVVICLFFARNRGELLKDKQRLRNNIESLTSEISYFRTRNGELMANNGILVMEKNEIRQLYEGKIMEELKNMKVKLNKLESMSLTGMKSTTIIETKIRDSLRIVDGDTVEPLKVIDYESRWLDFYQVMYNDYARTKIIKRDSLIQVVYQPTKEGFILLRPLKRKPPLEQNIRSADPNSIITYSRYIKPVKKRSGN